MEALAGMIIIAVVGLMLFLIWLWLAASVICGVAYRTIVRPILDEWRLSR